MKIATVPDFFDILKGKHLLLDASVFIDASIHETEFTELFNKLKDNNITLVTIAPVLFEFLKGTPDIVRFKAKKASVEKIIDAYLPLQVFIEKDLSDLTECERLIDLYKIEGASVSITDLLLGQQLLHYPNKLFLLTKNTTDFPTNIFNLATHLNLLHRKAIQSYGIYKLPRTESPRFSLKSLQEQQKTYPHDATYPRKTVIASSIHPRSKRAGFSASDYNYLA